MACRVDTAPLLSGACVVSAYTGHGVPGSAVPSTGTHGPSPIYNDLSLPADAAKEYRWAIVTPPASGSLVIYEDGSYAFTAPGSGSYGYTYRLWEDGADKGTAAVSITVAAVVTGVAAGAYAIGGEPAAITAARPATADTGQYAVAGLAASIVVARAAAISAGAYTIDGRHAAVSAARLGAADAGAYAITGLPAQLAVVGTAGASLGVYSISGAPALVATTALAHNGAYVIDGAAALTHRAAPIDAGVYAIGGQPASFAAFLATTALPGSYAIAGLPAQIRVGTSSGGYASAADVWSYVLANGKTAEQNMVENNTMLSMLLAGGAWGAAIEGSYTAADLLRICAAVLAGRSRITSLGNGRAHVEFDAVGGADLRVAAEMNGSERQAVALTL